VGCHFPLLRWFARGLLELRSVPFQFRHVRGRYTDSAALATSRADGDGLAAYAALVFDGSVQYALATCRDKLNYERF
jgi:hypothetical protein